MIELIIFDLDGTLLNTLDDLANSCNYILKKYNFPTHPIGSYRYFIGNGVGKLVERALPENERDPAFIEEMRKEFVAYYSQHAEDTTSPYPGTIDLLLELQSRGIKLSIASNKFISATQSLAKKYFKEINFSSVLGQREGVPIKPDPQIVFDVMNESGVTDAKKVLYLGDSGPDMQTCINAGIKGIGVLWGFRDEKELRENGASIIIQSPDEVLNILDNNR